MANGEEYPLFSRQMVTDQPGRRRNGRTANPALPILVGRHAHLVYNRDRVFENVGRCHRSSLNNERNGKCGLAHSRRRIHSSCPPKDEGHWPFRSATALRRAGEPVAGIVPNTQPNQSIFGFPQKSLRANQFRVLLYSEHLAR